MIFLLKNKKPRGCTLVGTHRLIPGGWYPPRRPSLLGCRVIGLWNSSRKSGGMPNGCSGRKIPKHFGKSNSWLAGRTSPQFSSIQAGWSQHPGSNGWIPFPDANQTLHLEHFPASHVWVPERISFYPSIQYYTPYTTIMNHPKWWILPFEWDNMFTYIYIWYTCIHFAIDIVMYICIYVVIYSYIALWNRTVSGK